MGLLFKVGAAPFHAWTPDVYQGAPTAVTAFMAACTKIAAFGALLRLFYVAFGGAERDWTPMIWIVAILTMAVGWVFALTQTDIKRMLAYSSIAHAGFLLVGFVGLHQADRRRHDISSLQAVLFYLVTYGFMTVGAFGDRDAGPRRRRRGQPPVAVGRAGQGVAAGGRRLRVLPAGDGRASR